MGIAMSHPDDFTAQIVPPRETFRIVGLAPRTAERRLRDLSSGFPKPFRIGGRRYWRRGDIEAYAEPRRGSAEH